MNTLEPAQASVRPLHVTLAIALLGVALFLAPIRSIFRTSWESPLRASVPVLVLVGIAVLWLYGLHRRKRWLWWFTVVVLLFGVISIPWGAARQGLGFQRSLYYMQYAASIPALLLLCLPTARKWFDV